MPRRERSTGLEGVVGSFGSFGATPRDIIGLAVSGLVMSEALGSTAADAFLVKPLESVVRLTGISF